MLGRAVNIKDIHKDIWINPIGGYSDFFIFAGVLKRCIDLKNLNFLSSEEKFIQVY